MIDRSDYRTDGVERKITTMNLSKDLLDKARKLNRSMSALVEQLLEFAVKNPKQFRKK